jgi:arabinan endo-1,5-alpha-L-arabinosidase
VSYKERLFSFSFQFFMSIHYTISKMYKFLKTISAAALVAVAAVQAYSDPGACSGYCWAHDPAVIQRASDGTYFKFNTGTGIQYATASSIAGPWTIQGYVLPDGSSIDNSGSDDPWVYSPKVQTE